MQNYIRVNMLKDFSGQFSGLFLLANHLNGTHAMQFHYPVTSWTATGWACSVVDRATWRRG